MDKIHFENLSSELNILLLEASERLSNLIELSYELKPEDDYSSEEYDLEKMTLLSLMERIRIIISTLIELLQLKSLLKDFNKQYKKLKKNRLKQDLIEFTGEWKNDTMLLFWRYLKTITLLISTDNTKLKLLEKKTQLESILSNTALIVKQFKVEPKNETEVKNCMYNTLIHSFPDIVKEIPISKESKTYKPDIGVKSLKCAIEYKFADSKEEVKKSLGGIYEDIIGYSGSNDWDSFYAVIYMTDVFFTTEQLMSEFESTPDNWKLILVYGKGARIKKEKS